MNKPVAETDYQEIARFYSEMETILKLSDERLTAINPEKSGWSAAQQIYHVSWANAATWKGIGRILEQKDPAVPEGEPNRIGQILFRVGRMRRGAFDAPDFARPPAEMSVEEARLWARRSQEAFERMSDAARDLPEESYRIPHFALGHLDARQWLAFIRIHSLHHLTIIHDILGTDQTAH